MGVQHWTGRTHAMRDSKRVSLNIQERLASMFDTDPDGREISGISWVTGDAKSLAEHVATIEKERAYRNDLHKLVAIIDPEEWQTALDRWKMFV